MAALPLKVLADASTTTAADAFVADVVREVVNAERGGNVVLSPFSLQGVLALAAIGARAATRTQLQAALGMPDLEAQTIHARFETPMLKASRAIFVRRVAIAPGYRQAMKRALDAQALPLPADERDALRVINEWADLATEHRIPAVCQSLSNDAVLVLADAVYLKFRWRYVFDRARTQPRAFHRSHGGPVSVPMMSGNFQARAGTCRAGQYLRLPFAGVSGGIDLILPAPGISAEQALDIVMRSPGELEPGAGGHGDLMQVELTLPKVEMRSTGSLKSAVAKAGLGEVLARANLGGVAPGLDEVAIGELLQEAWMKIDEEGVEAAAVTLATVEITGMRVVPPLTLVFDRPFALVIRDNATLFAAVVRDPSAKA